MSVRPTPGPWLLDDQIDTIFITDADGSPIAAVEVGEGPDEAAPAEADAQLIVSAPDLLVACEEMLSAIDAMRTQGVAVIRPEAWRAAIAKARGK